MEKIQVLFLGIEGFEAFSLASLPVLQSESVRRIFIHRVKKALGNEGKYR